MLFFSIISFKIAAFEHQALRPGGSAAFSLLQDLCQQLKTVEELITYLKAIGNQEALLVIKPHGEINMIVKYHKHFSLKLMTNKYNAC